LAAKLDGLKLSESEVSQTIDLKEVFGVSLTGNEALKQTIGQAIIDRIIERTESGKSVYGGNLRSPYSKAYEESDDFKAFGKKPDRVNMKLTGQMLGTLDIVETSGSRVKIGWDDATENAKAFNHQTGDTVYKRPFFGITKKELGEIKREFADQVKEEAGKMQSDIDAIRAAIIRRLNPNTFETE
jgi:hypothetical protein